MWSRRAIIENVLKSTALGLPLPRLVGSASAAEVEPHFIVYLQVYGAWDVCLAFDPKDRDSLTSIGTRAFDQPYAFSEVKEYAGMRFGPAAFPLAAAFADRMAIVNGIDMELDSGHTPASIMSGDSTALSSSKPFLQAILSDRNAYVRSRLIPHLYASYDGFFSAGNFGAKSIAISQKDAYSILFGTGSSGSELLKVEASTQFNAASYQGSARTKLKQYEKALRSASALREKLSGAGAVEFPENASSMGSMVGRLFQSGLLGSLTWSLGEAYNFDTHFNHYAQHPLAQALTDVTSFCQSLAAIKFDEERSVMDLTTVVMAGEFARTPLLNSSAGKDHNFRTNTIAFIGKNVRAGGFGASGERRLSPTLLESHAGLPVSLVTGRPDAGGSVLKSRQVWAGSGKILGADLTAEFGEDTKAIKFLGV